MSVTTEQYTGLLTRLTRIENTLNDILTAQNQFVTLSQVNQVLTVLTNEVDDLRTQVTALEARVTTIENEPLS